MKDRILYILNFIWTSFVAFSFPICLGLVYMDITSHAKGYGYDLGSEKDVSIIMGIIELIIWIALAVPSHIYIFKRTVAKGKHYMIFKVVFYLLLSFLCIYLIGGWNEFMRFFHY